MYNRTTYELCPEIKILKSGYMYELRPALSKLLHELRPVLFILLNLSLILKKQSTHHY